MTLFDGAQGSPLGLGMFGGGQPQGGGFLQGFEQRLQNPLVAAALGLSGGTLGANEQGAGFGSALAQGLMGGAGSAIGAARMNRQRQEEDERKRLMQALLERYAGVANRPQQMQAPYQGPVFGAQTQTPGLY